LTGNQAFADAAKIFWLFTTRNMFKLPLSSGRRLIFLAIAIAATLLMVSPSAQAGYTVRLQEVGPDVVAAGSGPIDLTGLCLATGLPFASFIRPTSAYIRMGSAASGLVDVYVGIRGPDWFGSGLSTLPNSCSGDLVGVWGVVANLYVPPGYVSGAALSDSMTFNNATFASLGVTPGTYEWTWGTGRNQNFTVHIGAAGVPDAGSTLGLFFLSLLGLVGLSRFHSLRLAQREGARLA
jgi:hypothetical protein